MAEERGADVSRGTKVLIVEDSTTQAICLQSTLEQNGFPVSVANNGARALEILKTSKPAIVISDIMMPEMDGYELCKHLKADDNFNHIPVILLTTLSSTKNILKGLECGADGFILKPYDDGHLISQIKHVLALQQMDKQVQARTGVDILYEDQQYHIHLCPQQIIDNLISAYETTIKNNNELTRVQDELRVLNSSLEEKVNERTRDLELEIREHERVEEALRESERRFRDMLESIDLMAVMVDEEGNIMLCNDFLLDSTGWQKEEIMGKNWLDVFVPDADKEIVKESVLQTISTGKPTRYEYEILTRYGGRRHISFNRSVIRDHDNKAIGIASIGEDVTERRRAEQSLKQSEEKYRTLFETMTQGVVYQDAKGRIISANSAAESILRSTLDQMRGKTALALHGRAVHEDGSDFPVETHPAMVALKTGQEVRNVIMGIAHPESGDYGWINVNAVPQFRPGENKPYQVYATFDDITELKQMELIKENEKRLRDITSALGEGLFMLNEKGQLTFMNPEAERLLGWTEAELKGKDMHEVIHYQKADGIHVSSADCPVNKVIETGNIFRIDDDMFTRRGGEMFSVAYVTTPIMEDGKIIASITAFQDITERKKAEEAKQNLKKLQKTFDGTVYALASIAEKRDPYTAGHQQCVAGLACGIGRKLGLPEEKIEGIRVAGILHDIGKISVPAEILSKPSKLSEAEFSIIKEHSQHGYDILRTIEFPWPIAKIVLQHHERIDGSGYPYGLTGDDLLLEAKILAVADTIDAMASHRPYRPALGMEKALEEISANKGILYDPEVVDACLKYLAENDSKCA